MAGETAPVKAEVTPAAAPVAAAVAPKAEVKKNIVRDAAGAPRGQFSVRLFGHHQPTRADKSLLIGGQLVRSTSWRFSDRDNQEEITIIKGVLPEGVPSPFVRDTGETNVEI